MQLPVPSSGLLSPQDWGKKEKEKKRGGGGGKQQQEDILHEGIMLSFYVKFALSILFLEWDKDRKSVV